METQTLTAKYVPYLAYRYFYIDKLRRSTAIAAIKGQIYIFAIISYRWETQPRGCLIVFGSSKRVYWYATWPASVTTKSSRSRDLRANFNLDLKKSICNISMLLNKRSTTTFEFLLYLYSFKSYCRNALFWTLTWPQVTNWPRIEKSNTIEFTSWRATRSSPARNCGSFSGQTAMGGRIYPLPLRVRIRIVYTLHGRALKAFGGKLMHHLPRLIVG